MTGGLQQLSGHALQVASGAELDIGAGGLSLVGGDGFTADGTLGVTGGTADFTYAALDSPDGTTVLSSGTLVLGSRTGKTGTFDATGTSLAPSVVNAGRGFVVNTLDVAGVGLQTGAGATVVEDSASIAAGATLDLDGGRKLANHGAMALDGTVELGANPGTTALGGGMLANMTNATLDLGDGANVIGGTGSITLANLGELTTDTGSGTATVSVPVRNAGTILADSGVLLLDGGGVSLGRKVELNSGGTIGVGGGSLEIKSGALALSGGLAITGGTLDLSHEPEIDINGNLAVRGGTLNLGVRSALAGGLVESGTPTIEGTGVVTIAGNDILGGAALWTGRGDTVLQGTGTLTATARLYLDNDRMLEVHGTLTDSGGQILFGQTPSGTASGDGVLTNQGSVLFAADDGTAGVLDHSAMVSGVGFANFDNFGYAAKTAGTGQTVIEASVFNAGTIEAASGTLVLGGGEQGPGTYQIDDGCVMELGGMATSGQVTFAGSAGTAVIDDPADFGATIAGFGTGGTIDLAGVTNAPTLSYDATDQILTVTGGGITAYLYFANDLSSHSFTVADDHTGGALIT